MSGNKSHRLSRATVISLLTFAALVLHGVQPPPASARPGSPRTPSIQSTSARITTLHHEFTTPGPSAVRSNVRTVSCADSAFGSLVAAVARLDGASGRLTCSDAFPYGLAAPLGVHLYYPSRLDAPTPPVVFMPGVTADPGMYDRLARLWASHGFVVAIAYDFWNSMPESPTLGIGVLRQANDDRRNPLYRKVDFSRTTFAGHSAGGQSALLAASLFPGVAHLIDPRFRVSAVMPIAEGPLALGSAVRAPALVLTGERDWVVPAWSWPQVLHFGLMQSAPAYFAAARGAGHLAVLEPITANPFAAVSTAWLLYTAFHDADAAEFFAGPSWLLPHDKAFTGVQRNRIAAASTPPDRH